MHFMHVLNGFIFIEHEGLQGLFEYRACFSMKRTGGSLAHIRFLAAPFHPYSRLIGLIYHFWLNYMANKKLIENCLRGVLLFLLSYFKD